MDFKSVSESANYLLTRTKYRPKVGIICGSGLGSLGDSVDPGKDVFSYADIPHFPISTAPSHRSKLIFGLLNGVEVLIFQGRFHLYEGYSIQKISMPVRVMKLLGVEYLILTNAAGGLNQDMLDVGDFMVTNDHINIPGFSGVNPLAGPNENSYHLLHWKDFLNGTFVKPSCVSYKTKLGLIGFGPRFLELSEVYDRELIDISLDVANKIGLDKNVHEGVFTMLGGPTFETPAEL